MKSYSINLKEDSIYQLFIKIAIPSSIGTIFQNLYSVVDSIFAGKMISIFALAAILTPPDPITQIGLGIPLLILYELSILSVKFIEKKKKDA